MSPVEYFFWRPIKLNQYPVLSWHAQMVFKFFSLLSSQEKSIWSFCWPLWKHLLILKVVWKPYQISVQAFLCSNWSIFSSVHSQPAFGTIFRITGEFPQLFKAQAAIRKPEKAPLKKVTGRNFTISKWFHISKQKLHFGFPSQKDNWKLWKP